MHRKTDASRRLSPRVKESKLKDAGRPAFRKTQPRAVRTLFLANLSVRSIREIIHRSRHIHLQRNDAVNLEFTSSALSARRFSRFFPNAMSRIRGRW
ncbi:hypothetical protein PUN28_013462 [Cardiocondyla obscurior]|uniref:Uncharacterized protein n=1 Tax=Cardiocondyla obscurior TaxID=286306 RepID=A0AAW2F3W2_9HYME